MPYIAKYSANNGPVQYVDANNKVNFIGYAQSAENLTSAFYIRSTVNISNGQWSRYLPDSGYHGHIYPATYGQLYVTLGQSAKNHMLDNSILSSVSTFQDNVDVFWYEDSGTDYDIEADYPWNYYLTKIGDVPSALARGYVNTADCSLCTCSSFIARTGYSNSDTANIGILCFPPYTARAGYFVCVKKKDFDTTNVMFNTELTKADELSALAPYNRLLALNIEYNCNSATDFYYSYMYYDCQNYERIQNVNIQYGVVPSASTEYGHLTYFISSPVYLKGRPDSDVSACAQPTRILKNIDLQTNFSAAASAYEYSSHANGKIRPSTYGYWSATYDVVDNVNATIGDKDPNFDQSIQILNASNAPNMKTFVGTQTIKTVFNCDFGDSFYTRTFADNCAVVKSKINDGSSNVIRHVKYKLIDSSAVYTNEVEYADPPVNRVDFENDIINSHITARQNGYITQDNILRLNFSAANYQNVDVKLSAHEYYGPDSFEITLPASAQSAFTFSSNDVPYTITTY